MKYKDTPGGKVFLARKDAGLSQDDLCIKMNISQAMLSMLENGSREITYERACEFSNHLDITAEDIIYEGYELRDTIGSRISGMTIPELRELELYTGFIIWKRNNK